MSENLTVGTMQQPDPSSPPMAGNPHSWLTAARAPAPIPRDSGKRGRRGVPRKRDLSDAEQTTLVLVAKGYSDRECAEMQFRSHHTIKDRVRAILLKLDVHTRVEAAVWAAKQGLV